MSDDLKGVHPYQSLGAWLKRIREKAQESLLEVSGAVEIEVSALERLEVGDVRPGEDILLLLISHFSLKDDEADKLWKLAGYSIDTLERELDKEPKTITISRAEARIDYTDMVHVFVNDYGVIIDFMQSASLGGEPAVVSRLGMSREHVRSVIDILQRSLRPIEPKTLPASTRQAKKTKQKTDQ